MQTFPFNAFETTNSHVRNGSAKRQIQADTSRYDQIQADTTRYDQIQTDTNRYKQIQTDTTN